MDEKTKKAHENWIKGVDPRLEVMSAEPLVLSTPVPLLAESRITDKKHLFIRNIQDLPEAMTMEPLVLAGWEIELTGLIRPFRVTIKAEDLLQMEQVESGEQVDQAPSLIGTDDPARGGGGPSRPAGRGAGLHLPPG